MEEVSVALAAAREALMRGDKTTARAELAAVLRSDQRNAQAWLLMSGIVATPEQQRDCLARVLAIEPANAAARRGLDALEAAAAPATLAVPGAPPPAPSGLRRLAGAPYSPDAAAPADAAAAPGWPQPAAPGGGMQPTFSSAPAAPQYGPAAAGAMDQPALAWSPGAPARQGMSPLLRSVLVGLVAMVVVLGVVGALVAKQRKATPPTPKISAQDRTTGFINAYLGYYNNPSFLNADADTVGDVFRPTAEQYLVPDYIEEFVGKIEDGRRLKPVDPALVSRAVREIKQAYIANPRYTVVEQTPTTITLEVAGGEVWIVMYDGRTANQPISDNFRRVDLENIDGVWYVKKIDFDE